MGDSGLGREGVHCCRQQLKSIFLPDTGPLPLLAAPFPAASHTFVLSV